MTGKHTSLDGPLRQEYLRRLEERIWTTEPRLRFLCAPGLLFAAIAWLQSQMVRVIVLQCAGETTGHAPRELWRNMGLFREHVVPKLHEAHRKDLGAVAKEFRRTFCLSRDEDQALWCLQCLRNMLAHGALSPYQVSDKGDGPTLAYLPAPKGKNNPCRHCAGYPCTDARGGVTVGFGSDQVQSYFGDLRTAGNAVDRIAFCLELEHAELL